MLFYGTTRRRMDVPLDNDLREETTATADRLRELIAIGETPTVQIEAKCKSCSLVNECLPKVTGGRGAAEFLQKQLDRHLAASAPETDSDDRQTL